MTGKEQFLALLLSNLMTMGMLQAPSVSPTYSTFNYLKQLSQCLVAFNYVAILYVRIEVVIL